MTDSFETQRKKRPFIQIKRWLIKHYEGYSPSVEEDNRLSITYNENGLIYKLFIQICDSTRNIRYFVELPYIIDSCIYEPLIERINSHHLNTCIGRYDLDQKKGKLRFNYWNSYNPEKLDFDLIDNGMGVAMICCKETFGIIDKGVVRYEQNSIII